MRAFPPKAESVGKEHGRLEIRKIWTSSEINDYVNFPYCGQVACLERHREEIKSGKIHNETVYLITSLSQDDADGERLLNLIRGHWGIENKSHYVRDVTFDLSFELVVYLPAFFAGNGFVFPN